MNGNCGQVWVVRMAPEHHGETPFRGVSFVKIRETRKFQRIWNLETPASFTGGVDDGSTRRGPNYCISALGN